MHELVPIHKSSLLSSCQDTFPLWADGLKSEPIMNENMQLYWSTLEFCPGKLIILSTSADTVYPFSSDLHTAQTMFQNNVMFKSKLPNSPLPPFIPSAWMTDWLVAIRTMLLSGAPLDYLHHSLRLSWTGDGSYPVRSFNYTPTVSKSI